jgi:hypothetical protein
MQVLSLISCIGRSDYNVAVALFGLFFYKLLDDTQRSRVRALDIVFMCIGIVLLQHLLKHNANSCLQLMEMRCKCSRDVVGLSF